MGVEVAWDTYPKLKPKTVILFAICDPWDWADFEAALERLRGVMEEAANGTTVLIDMTQTLRAPAEIVYHFRNMPHLRNPKVDRVLLIGMNWFYRVVSDTVALLFPQYAEMASTFDTVYDAHRYLLGEDDAAET